jgi:sulfatase maturation enzyme AslB (radical SAM superfamily)
MHCPRLDHFVRFNPNGTVGCCGHMTNNPTFKSYDELQSSDWLAEIKNEMSRDAWPVECQRCKTTEQESGNSIRLDSINRDRAFKSIRKDYLIVGGVLDNVCNSACLTCSADHSTKIGSLTDKKYIKINNTDRFWSLPQERIVHLDINGGEPSHSKNYKHLLANLPKNVKSVRLNTNCSKVLEELLSLVERGIHVTVTVSLDGIGDVHDFVRWPIKWNKFYKNLQRYMEMPVKLNTWTTVSALNVDDLPNIIEFTKQHNLEHSYAYLTMPRELAVENKGTLESLIYIQEQKRLRGIE